MSFDLILKLAGQGGAVAVLMIAALYMARYIVLLHAEAVAEYRLQRAADQSRLAQQDQVLLGLTKTLDDSVTLNERLTDELVKCHADKDPKTRGPGRRG